MPDGSRAAQGAIFAVLSGNVFDNQSPPNAVPIYDRPPQDEQAMYIRIGEDSGSNSDTKIENGVQHDITIDVYSIYHGLQQVKYVMGQIYDLLQRATLTAAGFQITPPRMTFSTSFAEPDGSRGVLRFTTTTIEV